MATTTQSRTEATTVCWQQTDGGAAEGSSARGRRADDKQPRCAGDRRGGDDDEHAGDAGFDRKNGAPSVGDCETDVDRGDAPTRTSLGRRPCRLVPRLPLSRVPRHARVLRRRVRRECPLRRCRHLGLAVAAHWRAGVGAWLHLVPAAHLTPVQQLIAARRCNADWHAYPRRIGRVVLDDD